ncbi:hypothetical protein KP509_22G042400 [Ceratopteris richardii]|uniref:Uncharacterized protein n=1 Tax=Ceratopteris richardii TaxID=49495 RepID=A0A8T2S5C9_CERRI|nr:hypothetical protein KP509_22G042400 [Ceratopteris richardii]
MQIQVYLHPLPFLLNSLRSISRIFHFDYRFPPPPPNQQIPIISLAILSRYTYCTQILIIQLVICFRHRYKQYGFHQYNAAFFLGGGSIYQEQSPKKEADVH